MAIIKHLASKSANYERALTYLMFEHDKLTKQPVRNEQGNSVRKYDAEKQAFMERDIDAKAGYKHHLTDKYEVYLKQDLMQVCERENLHQVDLLSPAKKRVTEKEYWAGVRGQHNLDRRVRRNGSDNTKNGNSASIVSDMQKSDFQLQKNVLRTAIEEVSADAGSEDDFARLLKEKYNITLKISRGRYSYIHPHRERPITGKALGTDYTEYHLKPLFAQNFARENDLENATSYKGEKQNEDSHRNPVTEEPLHKKPQTKLRDTHHVPYPYEFTMPTDIRLVRDLQTCAKAKVNRAYERQVKLENLQEMAKTILYVQEHSFETADVLDADYDALQTETTAVKKDLRKTGEQIRGLNEQIHYTGQYLANKKVYAAFLQTRNKARFRNEHANEIAQYEAAQSYLTTRMKDSTLPSQGIVVTRKDGAFPDIKSLKAGRDALIRKQKNISRVYNEQKER